MSISMFLSTCAIRIISRVPQHFIFRVPRSVLQLIKEFCCCFPPYQCETKYSCASSCKAEAGPAMSDLSAIFIFSHLF